MHPQRMHAPAAYARKYAPAAADHVVPDGGSAGLGILKKFAETLRKEEMRKQKKEEKKEEMLEGKRVGVKPPCFLAYFCVEEPERYCIRIYTITLKKGRGVEKVAGRFVLELCWVTNLYAGSV